MKMSENPDCNFVNILDKGYHLTLAVWESSRQHVIQPVFTKDDNKFTTHNVLYLAGVATEKPGNERAVTYGKLSGLFQRGYHLNMDPVRFHKSWLVWNFQVNFLYKPIL